MDRFAAVGAEEIKKLLVNKDSENTKKLMFLENICSTRKSVMSLCWPHHPSCLKQFYVEARRNDGTDYRILLLLHIYIYTYY